MAIGKHSTRPEDDLGFGNQTITERIVNRDGSLNVKRKGLGVSNTSNNYHRLIAMSWSRFWLMVLSGYLIANIVFAEIYMLLGPKNLAGSDAVTPFRRFLDAFFFSAQTLSTVGYGHISPVGIPTNSVAAFESMVGLLAFALATGLLYGRFSRPSAKLIYSDKLLISPYKDNINGLMFRLANKRINLLLDLAVELIISYNETVDGKTIRRFFPLTLERSTVQILTLSWTVVHPLDESSPLKNITLDDLKNSQATFLILVRAFDDTFSQTVWSRTSYQYNEMVWGGKFVPAFYPGQGGSVVLDLSKISTYKPAELNTL